jgi:hypothetical protein
VAYTGAVATAISPYAPGRPVNMLLAYSANFAPKVTKSEYFVSLDVTELTVTLNGDVASCKPKIYLMPFSLRPAPSVVMLVPLLVPYK